MIPLDLLIELIFSVVKLLTDSFFRKSPHGRVATNLMPVGHKLDGVKRLLGA